MQKRNIILDTNLYLNYRRYLKAQTDDFYLTVLESTAIQEFMDKIGGFSKEHIDSGKPLFNSVFESATVLPASHIQKESTTEPHIGFVDNTLITTAISHNAQIVTFDQALAYHAKDQGVDVKLLKEKNLAQTVNEIKKAKEHHLLVPHCLLFELEKFEVIGN